MMTTLSFFQVDAFTTKPFSGNPAAVMPLLKWYDDATLQAIAVENNLSETAFFISTDAAKGRCQLRWFTPEVEVDLCGHATLATAHIILGTLYPELEQIVFDTRSGALTVGRGTDGALTMDFPNLNPEPAELPKDILSALGGAPKAVLMGIRQGECDRDYLIVYEDEAAVRALKPDFSTLAQHGLYGFIATAPGDSHDFVSRCFFPAYQINEDPVTGSAHCVSGPYWAKHLGMDKLDARQISARGGDLVLEVDKDRVRIHGHAITVIRGDFTF